MTKPEFIEYCAEFYGSGPDVIYPMGATNEQIAAATELLLARFGDEVCFDSLDRERVRDIMIEEFKLVWPGTYTGPEHDTRKGTVTTNTPTGDNA